MLVIKHQRWLRVLEVMRAYGVCIHESKLNIWSPVQKLRVIECSMTCSHDDCSGSGRVKKRGQPMRIFILFYEQSGVDVFAMQCSCIGDTDPELSTRMSAYGTSI